MIFHRWHTLALCLGMNFAVMCFGVWEKTISLSCVKNNIIERGWLMENRLKQGDMLFVDPNCFLEELVDSNRVINVYDAVDSCKMQLCRLGGVIQYVVDVLNEGELNLNEVTQDVLAADIEFFSDEVEHIKPYQNGIILYTGVLGKFYMEMGVPLDLKTITQKDDIPLKMILDEKHTSLDASLFNKLLCQVVQPQVGQSYSPTLNHELIMTPLKALIKQNEQIKKDGELKKKKNFARSHSFDN